MLRYSLCTLIDDNLTVSGVTETAVRFLRTQIIQLSTRASDLLESVGSQHALYNYRVMCIFAARYIQIYA